MSTAQLGARIDKELIRRIKDFASGSSRSDKAVVEICLSNFLPVLESGIYGTPVWDEIKARWDDDLAAAAKGFAEMKREIGGARPAKRRAA